MPQIFPYDLDLTFGRVYTAWICQKYVGNTCQKWRSGDSQPPASARSVASSVAACRGERHPTRGRRRAPPSCSPESSPRSPRRPPPASLPDTPWPRRSRHRRSREIRDHQHRRARAARPHPREQDVGSLEDQLRLQPAHVVLAHKRRDARQESRCHIRGRGSRPARAVARRHSRPLFFRCPSGRSAASRRDPTRCGSPRGNQDAPIRMAPRSARGSEALCLPAAPKP